MTRCYKNKNFCPYVNNVAYIQAKFFLKDSQYDDVFSCCFDKEEYIRKKEEIEKWINAYCQLLEEFDMQIDSDDFGVEKIDDESCYNLGLLRRYIVINNRPFLYLYMALSGSYRIDYPTSDYFAIQYSIQLGRQGELYVNYLVKGRKYEYRTFKQEERHELMSMIFDYPENYESDVHIIADKIKLHFGKEVSTSDSIRYDRMSCCYYVSDSVFKTLMADFQPVTAKDDIELVGKYTSLNTLVETLKSKKI